jgi:hypothetical protein
MGASESILASGLGAPDTLGRNPHARWTSLSVLLALPLVIVVVATLVSLRFRKPRGGR